MNIKRVFSGVQPTGNLHLGNYLGAIKNFVDLQNKFECIYCIVDLHAITNRQVPKELKSNVLETAASFVAAGFFHGPLFLGGIIFSVIVFISVFKESIKSLSTFHINLKNLAVITLIFLVLYI